jgi:hypothetical protein
VLCYFLVSCESEPKSKEAEIVEKAIVDAEPYERYGSSPDILNNIYEEILKTDTTLSRLDGSVYFLLRDKQVALEKPFKLYDQKNNLYYENAYDLLSSFSDSLLKQKYATMIQKSLENYHEKTKDLRDIINNHDLKAKKIEELRSILRLTKTLVYIERYQDKSKPNKDTLLTIDKELDNKIKELQKFIPR